MALRASNSSVGGDGVRGGGRFCSLRCMGVAGVAGGGGRVDRPFRAAGKRSATPRFDPGEPPPPAFTKRGGGAESPIVNADVPDLGTGVRAGDGDVLSRGMSCVLLETLLRKGAQRE